MAGPLLCKNKMLFSDIYLSSLFLPPTTFLKSFHLLSLVRISFIIIMIFEI